MSSGVLYFVGGVVAPCSGGVVGVAAGWGGERGRVFLGVKLSASFSPSSWFLDTIIVSFTFRGSVSVG